MANWKERLEEIIASLDEQVSPSKIRKHELSKLIREQCRDLIQEEIQKVATDMLYHKIFVIDKEKVHEEPKNETLLPYKITWMLTDWKIVFK